MSSNPILIWWEIHRSSVPWSVTGAGDVVPRCDDYPTAVGGWRLGTDWRLETGDWRTLTLE